MGKFRIDEIQRISDNTSAYATEPVTVAELKEYLQISGTAYDNRLVLIILSARMRIEQVCNVSLVPKSLVVIGFLPSSYNSFNLPLGPIDEITSIEQKDKCGCGDWEVLDAALDDYCVISNNIFKSNYAGYIKATYTTNADERGIFHQAMLAQCAFQYNNRDGEGKLSEEVEMLLSSVTQTHY